MRSRTARIAALAAAGVFLAGACSSDESVGSGVEVGAGGGQGALRDQSTTTVAGTDQAATPTTAAPRGPATTQPAAQQSQGQPHTVQTAPPEETVQTVAEETPTTTRARPEVVIKITDAGTSFDPLIAQATVGGKVTWENTGSTARQVADRDNKYFVSPMIEPGATWSWVANVPAGTTVNYRDTTRPYAQAAKIEVT